MSQKLRRRAPMVALASLTLLGSAHAADRVAPGVIDVTETARAADAQIAAATLIRDASRRSGITAEGGYNAYELSTAGPAGDVWIRNRLVDGQTGAGAAMASERNDGQIGGFPLNAERYVVWYEKFVEMPTTSLDRWQVVGPEIHGPNVSAFPQALLMLEVGPDQRRRLNANAGRSSTRYRDIGPIQIGRTYAMKMRVRLSAGADGVIQIWRDGQLVVDLPGATIHTAVAGSYWKEANYRNANIDGPMTHDFSSLRIYNGDVSFPAGTTPAPAPPPALTPTPTPAPPPSTSTVPGLGQAVPAGTVQANPVFAAGLTGWASWQGGAVVTTASDGTRVATVSRTSGNVFAFGDASPAVKTAVPGVRYRAIAWVRAANAQSVGKVARVYARQLGTQDRVGSGVTLGTTWKQSVVELTARGTRGVNARVGFANAVSGDQMHVAMISTTRVASAAERRSKGSRRVAGGLSPRAIDLRAPARLVPGKSGAVTFRVPSPTRYTVTVLVGKKAVATYQRTAKAGLNRFGLRAPRTAGAYTVRLSLPTVSVSAPFRVGRGR